MYNRTFESNDILAVLVTRKLYSKALGMNTDVIDHLAYDFNCKDEFTSYEKFIEDALEFFVTEDQKSWKDEISWCKTTFEKFMLNEIAEGITVFNGANYVEFLEYGFYGAESDEDLEQLERSYLGRY